MIHSRLDAATVPTPVGPLTVLVDADGKVRAAGFTHDHRELSPLIHPELRLPVRAREELGVVTAAVRAYLAGELTALDDLPVRQHSGPWRGRAWSVLRDVKPGDPITYTAFAALAGRPSAVRAAASACARNAVALIVPCHRVLRLDGTLGGYRWGLRVKSWLLDHERQAAGLGVRS
ncbi:methylated-DNA--[protein]-cysteine S-methyltransferase [Solwaraspora sp. WMMD406]|uniref:methylated-DNA--[protein]-cysteine S-methyltransferase n=1 Tax=Solwaraspora sp. WMMD406 TaxID=3016095 RepID=UPI002416468A|nr:methylated-DNA--[protein]-cysteine S-methyltransferase [Solwaraspora sp. WMMD406]MDG4767806.1 methylated-DNA--[protein]-cysteine S-methyltransferase [Solwaraspora sp. WMMD406]